MRFTAFLIPTLVSAVVIPSKPVEDGPDPKEIQIISTSWSGNGCPQGSVSSSLSPDRKVVTFGFDKFQVYIGPGYSPTEKTKNCQLHLNLKYPPGFSFTVVESTYHGFAQLDPEVTANFYSTYYFSQNAGDTTTTATSITGGGVWKNGSTYTKVDQVPSTATVYSPCGASGILNINSRISLTSTKTSATGLITDDDATVAFTQQLNLQWQKCKK